MNLVTKITIIFLTLCLCGSFAFKNLGEKGAVENKISLEKEEKTDAESEELKLAFFDENELSLNGNKRLIPLEKYIHLSEFIAAIPTSPPNS